MERRSTNLLIAAVMVLAIGSFVWFGKDATASPPSGDDLLALVQPHATRASCWTVINGAVYDLTSWVPQHPGGEEAILQLCGTDGSEKFNGMHGGSEPQETILMGFRIDPTAQ